MLTADQANEIEFVDLVLRDLHAKLCWNKFERIVKNSKWIEDLLSYAI